MKKILYLLPFILYIAFYVFIILLEGGVDNIGILNVGLLLVLLLICGLGTLSKKKVSNAIGIISLFAVSFALIKMGIENTYFILAETKIAIAILIYYLIVFIISKNKTLIIMSGVAIVILLILFVPLKIQYRDGGTVEYKAIAYWYIKWTYKDKLTITDDNIVTIDTSYSIRDVKCTEYKEEYSNSEIGSENPVFNELDFNNENKTIDFKDFENGTYIITFTIHNDKDYADYAFKVEVKK